MSGWNGLERRESDFESAEEITKRHADQAVAAVRMHNFLSTLDRYKPAFISGGFILLVMLGTMAYGIVNTNQRAQDNQELYRETVRCVATLTDEGPGVTRAKILQACKEFTEEMEDEAP